MGTTSLFVADHVQRGALWPVAGLLHELSHGRGAAAVDRTRQRVHGHRQDVHLRTILRK